MIVHPTGHHGVMSQQEMATMALLTRAVHGFAIASLPIAFLGALALTRQLGSPDRLSVLALVVYGFGIVAVMMAATMSGLVFPSVMEQLVAGDPLLKREDYSWITPFASIRRSLRSSWWLLAQPFSFGLSGS